MTIWRTRIACRIPKATNAHSEYVMLIAFPLRRCLHERALMLRYTYICWLVPCENVPQITPLPPSLTPDDGLSHKQAVKSANHTDYRGVTWGGGDRSTAHTSRCISLLPSFSNISNCTTFTCNSLYIYGPGSSVGIATALRAGRSGIESRWGRDFSPVQTGSWGPPSLL